MNNFPPTMAGPTLIDLKTKSALIVFSDSLNLLDLHTFGQYEDVYIDLKMSFRAKGDLFIEAE
jgi:hypothetical protein